MSGVVGVFGSTDNFESGSSVSVLRVNFTANSGFMVSEMK
jgi:hypothetical protein